MNDRHLLAALGAGIALLILLALGRTTLVSASLLPPCTGTTPTPSTTASPTAPPQAISPPRVIVTGGSRHSTRIPAPERTSPTPSAPSSARPHPRPRPGRRTVRTCLSLEGPGPAGPGAASAVAFARAQVGIPYEWGGDGPAAGDDGYDCSGLTQAALAAAGIRVPRTAQTQYDAGPRLRLGQRPRAGDLVFFGGGPSSVTHVGLVVDATHMIDAPHTGVDIREEHIWTADLVGYSRPTAITSRQRATGAGTVSTRSTSGAG